jgi:hypothetical protein
MASPVSISLKNFSATAKTSVTKALETHKASFPNPNYRIGFIPPWWLGIILDNPADKVTLADAQALATQIHSNLTGPSLVAVPKGEPGIVCWPGHIICGFILPPDERPMVQE